LPSCTPSAPRVGKEHVEGAEIIGWDPARDAYITQYFGRDGPNAYEASLRPRRGGPAATRERETEAVVAIAIAFCHKRARLGTLNATGGDER
jgi:hypothetical protein